MKNYTKQLNLEFWNECAEQFMKIKHEVLKYLELEAKASWVSSEKIKEMKESLEAKFDSAEKTMMALQEQFNCNTTQYIKCGDDGKIVRYIFPE